MLLDVIPNRKKPFVPGYHSPSPLPRIKGRSKTRRTLAPIQRRRPPPLPQSARNAVPVAPSGMKIQGRQEPPRSGGRVWIFHCSVVRIRKPGIMKGRIWLFGQSSRRGGPPPPPVIPQARKRACFYFFRAMPGKGFPTPLKAKLLPYGSLPAHASRAERTALLAARGPIRPPCHPASPIRLRSPLQDNPEPA